MSKFEALRNDKMEEYFQNLDTDCGALGRIFELECARVLSRKTQVSKQGQTDVRVKVLVGDKVRYMKAECKTSGGRVGELLQGCKVDFVIYRMSFVQKHKAGKFAEAREELRETEPKIFTVEQFVEGLKSCGAIKAMSRNGEHDGDYGIQVSSKKWFEWVQTNGLEWDREKAYKMEEF